MINGNRASDARTADGESRSTGQNHWAKILVGGEAAFGRDRCAIHHARFVGGEEQGDVRDVLRLADSERVSLGHVVEAAEANLIAAGKATFDPFSEHNTGADGVDADTLRRVGAR